MFLTGGVFRLTVWGPALRRCGLLMTVHLTNPDTLSGVPAHPLDDRSPAKASSAYQDIFKPLVERILVVLSMPLTVPLVALMAVLVALDGHSPFYTQQRVGRGGKAFRIFKLRTMVPNADAFLAEYLAQNADAKAEWDAKQKLTNDPRVTRLGRVLRKTSLDELPQLLNVLTGSMSLIGPRPMMVEQRDAYPGSSYFDLRPGITGPWQVSERNETTFAARARFDDHYAATVSLRTDASILWRTIGVVVKGTGC